jgi:hypothetical protein
VTVSESQPSSNPLSLENLPTITAVAFILALLALAVTFMSLQRTSAALVQVASLELAAARRDTVIEKEVLDLRSRIEALEAKAAAAPPAPAAPTEPMVAAPKSP